MNRRIRWGILGTGQIAHQFAAALKRLPHAELLAVGSRALDSANRFAAEFDTTRRYSSYQSLVDDPDVDVVYVATPHSCHAENALLALNAGKAVLCEKPFTLNAAEAMAVIGVARAQKLFLMEAMWTRFFPLMKKVRELVADQIIGDVRLLTADFGFRAEPVDEPRLFDSRNGGGALFDVGVYPISLASMLFASPTTRYGIADMGSTGVDETAAIILGHAGGRLALLHTAVRLDTVQEAILTGTTGRIRIHSPWWRPTLMTVTRAGQTDERFEFPLPGNGYEYQAEEVMACLRSQRLESDLMPLDESLSILRTVDALRVQWASAN